MMGNKQKSVTSRERRAVRRARAALQSTLDVVNDPALMRQIEASRAFYAGGGKGLSFKEVFGEPLRPKRGGHR
jgi:hypothetical protein